MYRLILSYKIRKKVRCREQQDKGYRVKADLFTDISSFSYSFFSKTTILDFQTESVCWRQF